MADKANAKLLIAGAALIIALALAFLIRQATSPRETVRDPIRKPACRVAKPGRRSNARDRM
jgi:hypothetical protein